MTGFMFIITLAVMLMAFVALVIRMTHPAYKDRPLLGKSPKVHRPEPKINMPEPGICQCSDALCFHKMGGACEIVGCPCQMFIPSDARNDMLEELGRGTVARLALEAVNAETAYRTKARELDSNRNYR